MSEDVQSSVESYSASPRSDEAPARTPSGTDGMFVPTHASVRGARTLASANTRSATLLPDGSQLSYTSAPCSPPAVLRAANPESPLASSDGDSLCSAETSPVRIPTTVLGRSIRVQRVAAENAANTECSGSVPFTRTLTRTMSMTSTNPSERSRTVPKNLSNRFLVGNIIGRGSYAKVRDAYDLTHKTVVAIKIFNVCFHPICFFTFHMNTCA